MAEVTDNYNNTNPISPYVRPVMSFFSGFASLIFIGVVILKLLGLVDINPAIVLAAFLAAFPLVMTLWYFGFRGQDKVMESMLGMASVVVSSAKSNGVQTTGVLNNLASTISKQQETIDTATKELAVSVPVGLMSNTQVTSSASIPTGDQNPKTDILADVLAATKKEVGE